MAWTAPMTFVSGAALTASQLNTYLSGNLNEVAPAKATTSGGYFATTAANTIAERISNLDAVGTSETTASTSYVNLATAGPSLTVTSGGCALVMWSAAISNNTVNSDAFVAMDLSGASTGAPSDAVALRHTSATANAVVQCTYAQRFGTLAGSNTFAMKYRVSAGTGTFLNRRMSVFPF